MSSKDLGRRPMKSWIHDRDGKLKGMGSLVDKLYRLDCQPLTDTMEHASVVSQGRSDADLWHQHFGL